MRSMTLVSGCAALMLTLLTPEAGAQTITQIIDGTGDGTHGLDSPWGVAVEIAVEGAGNVYVAGSFSNNAFRVTPGGTAIEIIDATGDGTHVLGYPRGIAVDAFGNAYLTGAGSNNTFKVASNGTITEIISTTVGLKTPEDIAVEAFGTVYVTGWATHNAFRIFTGGRITEIIDTSGDGSNTLRFPRGIAVSASRNVYVTGAGSDNAFQIMPDRTITEIIDETGDGIHDLDGPVGIAVDTSGNIYVAGMASDNAFKITPDGTVTQIIDGTGDGTHVLDGPQGIATDAAEVVYVTGGLSDNAFKITPGGTITQIIDGTGDGTHVLDNPYGIAAEGSGVVYVVGRDSDNAFKITPPGMALSAVAGLVVPGFEVAVDDPVGPTTFFAVRNTSDQEVLGRVDYFGVASTEPLRTDPFVLEPQETLPWNVRDDLSGLEIEDGLATGFIVVTELGGTTAPHLEGDYFRVDFGNDFATGDRLVRPTDFCLRQEMRYVDFGSGSGLRVLLNRPRGGEVPSFSYTAYNEAGTMMAEGEVSTAAYLSVLDVGELVAGESFGTVLFDFSSSGGGWVSAKHSAFGRFSVELKAACRD